MSERKMMVVGKPAETDAVRDAVAAATVAAATGSCEAQALAGFSVGLALLGMPPKAQERGTCPHCRREIPLRQNGEFQRHAKSAARGWDECHGSGQRCEVL